MLSKVAPAVGARVVSAVTVLYRSARRPIINCHVSVDLLGCGRRLQVVRGLDLLACNRWLALDGLPVVEVGHTTASSYSLVDG